jgi:hypothetical protein
MWVRRRAISRGNMRCFASTALCLMSPNPRCRRTHPHHDIMFGMLVYLDTRPLSNGHVSAVDYHMNLSNANAASYPGPGYVLAPACACAWHDLGAERADSGGERACERACARAHACACACARVARAREDRTPSSWSRRESRARFSTAQFRTQCLVCRVRDAHRCALTVLWRQLLHHHPEPSAARRRDI